MIDLRLLMDVAVEFNLVPDEYFSLWDDLGSWQLDALRKVGMQPHHRLLDVGCGAMRLGINAVEYLDDGNYFGIDAFPPYIDAARELAVRLSIKKKFSLLASGDFAFDQFQTSFDYANAQSVFTHLSGTECDRCMAAIRRVMKPGGIFLFTYLIGAPRTQGLLYGAVQPMRRFAMTDPEYFAKLGKRHGATFEKVGIPHPTGQHVAVFQYPL